MLVILRNNAATCLSGDGIFMNGVLTNLLLSRTVSIWQSYDQKIILAFFDSLCSVFLSATLYFWCFV